MVYILKTTWIVLFFCVCYEGSNSLKNVHVKIPKAVVAGKDVILHCLFDLEGAGLYSVKWYKKNNEFFRYVPKETPRIRTFKIKGVDVLETSSNDKQILLQNVSLDSSGWYSCEVSADQPGFSTGVKGFYLQVVNLPISLPQVNGLKTRYLVGENIEINCQSLGNSPLNLTWFINGEIVNNTNTNYTEKMTFSMLNFTLTKANFTNNKLKIRCSATLYDVYHKSTEKSVIVKNTKINKFPHDFNNNFINEVHWGLAERAQKSLDSSWLHLDSKSKTSKEVGPDFSAFIIIVYITVKIY